MSDRRMSKQNNEGTTLIETLAAFTVLAAILAILFSIVDFSGRLRTQAVDTAHLDQMFQREMYKNDEKIDRNFVKVVSYNYAVADGADNESDKQGRFWLALDADKTDLEKNYLSVSYDEDTIRTAPPTFYLKNTSAAAYTCIDPLIDAEQLPRPMAMRFYYHEPLPAAQP